MLTELTRRLTRVTNGRPWVPEIDGLRFLAIAGVVLFHIVGEVFSRSGKAIAIEPRYWMLEWALGNGDRGVRLFFVISGLVLALPFVRHFRAGGKPVPLRNYFMRRVTRLEPPYIVSVLVFVVLLLLYTRSFQPDLARHVAATVFYLHGLLYGYVSPVNMVSWSLEVEVQFYLVAPLLMQVFRIKDKRTRRLLLLAFIVLALPLQFMVLGSPRLQASVLRYLSYFFAGLLAADYFVLDMPLWRERSAWDLVALGCMTLAVALRHDWEPAHAVMPLAFALLCLAAMRGPIFRRIVAKPWIAVIGGMCYSIYLVHMTAIAIIFKVSRKLIYVPFDSMAILLIQLLVFIPGVLLISGAFFVLVERPCMDPQWPLKLKRWLKHRNRNAAILTRS